MSRYKTHYKPNPCGRTGFQSEYTTNLNDVTCISCLVKNLMIGAYANREWGVIHTKTAVFLCHGGYDECKKRYNELEKDVMFVEILEEKKC